MQFIKIGFRNLFTNKNTSLVNLLGLTIALSSSVLIFMWVYDEVTFDRFQKNYQNTYLIACEWKYADGKSDYIMETPAPLSPFLKDNFPEVVQSTRFAKQFGGRNLKWENKKFLEQGLAIESSFFDIFTVDFIRGESKPLEDNPNSIFISEQLATKFFGNQDPLNQLITFFVNPDSTKQYQVSGVYKNLPANSSLQFDFLIPLPIDDSDNWFAFGYTTFLLLPDKIDKAQLNKKIGQFYDYEKLGFDIDWYLHPLKKMHFHSDFQRFVHHPGDIQYVYIFAIAGIFIMLIALINFISLMGILLSKRIKEAGIRKISGASTYKVALTFLAEPLILVLLALLLSLILVEILLPVCNSFSGSNIPSLFTNYFILLFLALMMLVIGIISGILPGMLISRVKPIDALNQKIIMHKGHFRRYLIVLQFTLSIILLSSTFIINKQLKYIFNKDLGFQKEAIIHIPLKGIKGEKYEVLKQEILHNPMIISVSNSAPFLSSGIEVPGWTWDGSKPEDKRSIARIQADADFIKTFGIKIVQGNYFSETRSNTNKVVINEEAAKVMNMANPINQHMQLKGKDYEIIGVVNNFHSRHFSNQIRPLVISFRSKGHHLYAKYDKAVTKASMVNALKKVHKKSNLEYPFEYHFVEDEFIAIYRNERRMLDVLFYFVIVAFLILSFGLYTLSKQIALSKTKEIGIRKVNGATTSEILMLLNKDFLKWVVIAFVLACPLAWYAMSKWLENFAYKTPLSWWIFALAGLLAMAIALLTVSFQSFKAATRNPIESLRYE